MAWLRRPTVGEAGLGASLLACAWLITVSVDSAPASVPHRPVPAGRAAVDAVRTDPFGVRDWGAGEPAAPAAADSARAAATAAPEPASTHSATGTVPSAVLVPAPTTATVTRATAPAVPVPLPQPEVPQDPPLDHTPG